MLIMLQCFRESFDCSQHVDGLHESERVQDILSLCACCLAPSCPYLYVFDLQVSVDSLSWDFQVSTLDDSNIMEPPKVRAIGVAPLSHWLVF